MATPPPRLWTRRRVLALIGASAGAGALALACRSEERDPDPGPGATAPDPAPPPAPAARAAASPPAPAPAATPESTPTPTPTPTPAPSPAPEATPAPRPVPPAGLFERALLPGTPWETPAYLRHSGVRGPVVMVLGGVHGNEPGGWLAAENIPEIEITRGSLIVVPRANVVATRLHQRTTEELGDLNRLYPGSSLAERPMARMASRLISLARQYRAELLLDLHESWQFYVERTIQGTAAIGQTMSAGPGPEQGTIAQAIADRVNAQVESERELLIVRTRFGGSFGGDPAFGDDTWGSGWVPGRGSSSLSVGRYVDGLTPVLVEMGQQSQPVERRAELHRAVVRAALEMRGML